MCLWLLFLPSWLNSLPALCPLLWFFAVATEHQQQQRQAAELLVPWPAAALAFGGLFRRPPRAKSASARPALAFASPDSHTHIIVRKEAPGRPLHFHNRNTALAEVVAKIELPARSTPKSPSRNNNNKQRPGRVRSEHKAECQEQRSVVACHHVFVGMGGVPPVVQQQLPPHLAHLH